MDEIELKRRTKEFALRAIKLAESLPETRTGRIVASQLIRCGTSVGANYRAACRARSKADFISKLGIVEEEADESAFWMEIIVEGGLMKPQLVRLLLDEANALVRIMTSSRITAWQRSRPPIKNQKSKIKNS
jgi:four helix bundle protein